MIAFRVLLLSLLIASFFVESFSYSYSSSQSDTVQIFNPLLLVFYWFSYIFTLLMLQGYFWRDFAIKNGFMVLNSEAGMSNDFSGTLVPSFKGKVLKLSFSPIKRQSGVADLVVFTRQYKEGGILRWRERKMDSIMKLQYNNVRLPHIVMNATTNENIRRSNLSTKFPDSWNFTFEGVHGMHYRAYTNPKNRILALQLFTPDVLNVIYEKMPSMDIETKGSSIWFVQRYGILDEKLARSMFDSINQFQLEFEKQLRSARLLQ